MAAAYKLQQQGSRQCSWHSEAEVAPRGLTCAACAVAPKLQPAAAINAELKPEAAPSKDLIDALPGARAVARECKCQLLEVSVISQSAES